MTERPKVPALSAEGMARIGEDPMSVIETIGGVRGVIESVIPAVLFTLAYTLSGKLWPAVFAALGVCVMLIIARIVTRRPVTPAVSGLFGVMLSAGVALLTGRAVDFFLVSLVKNSFFAVLYGGSALIGWPLLGVMLGFAYGEGTHWRDVPARRRVYTQASWLWCGMFLLRLAFQVPLFRDGNVGGLGVASVPLGLPLFGLVLVLTWLIIRRVPPARPPVEEEPVDEQPLDEQPAQAQPAEGRPAAPL